jgi:hypothetical protein
MIDNMHYDVLPNNLIKITFVLNGKQNSIVATDKDLEKLSFIINCVLMETNQQESCYVKSQ